MGRNRESYHPIDYTEPRNHEEMDNIIGFGASLVTEGISLYYLAQAVAEGNIPVAAAATVAAGVFGAPIVLAAIQIRREAIQHRSNHLR